MSGGDPGKVREVIERFAGLAVGLLGDVCADVWTFTRPKASPRPGPVPIFEQEDAAGIANLVAGLHVGRPGTVPVTLAEVLSVPGQ